MILRRNMVNFLQERLTYQLYIPNDPVSPPCSSKRTFNLHSLIRDIPPPSRVAYSSHAQGPREHPLMTSALMVRGLQPKSRHCKIGHVSWPNGFKGMGSRFWQFCGRNVWMAPSLKSRDIPFRRYSFLRSGGTRKAKVFPPFGSSLLLSVCLSGCCCFQCSHFTSCHIWFLQMLEPMVDPYHCPKITHQIQQLVGMAAGNITWRN